MAPNETTPTESADEGITSRVAESGTMPYAAELAPDDAAAPTGPAPRKRATRLNANFEITPEMVAWAQENAPQVDGKRATAMFMNHFMAKSGRDATKVDWVLTWKNWLLRDQKSAEEHAAKGRLTPEERLRATLALATDIDQKGIEA